MEKTIKLGILASGRGSNAVALIKEAQELPNVEVKGLICDRPGALVLEKAQELGVPHYLIVKSGDKAAHELEILKVLDSLQVEWVFLAGFMRILSKKFIQHYFDKHLQVSRILNIHPSLLPSFPGKSGYEDAYAHGVKISGCTVHFVEEGVDSGPIILQDVFRRSDADSLEDFKKRGLELEHRVYARVLKLLSEDRLKLIHGAEFPRPYVSIES